MTDPELLVRIDENVKYLRGSFDEHKEQFDEHVKEDKAIIKEYLRPLWEESQQRKGAERSSKLVAFFVGFIINVTIAGATAYAAIRALVVPKP